MVSSPWRINRAAKFAAPDDQRVVEQAALFQILDQPVAGLIHVLALHRQAPADVGVRVPVVVINLHEAHAALDQPPRQQRRDWQTCRASSPRRRRARRWTPVRWRCPSAPARWPACGTPFRIAGCACAFPDRRPSRKFISFSAFKPSSVLRRTLASTPAGLLMNRIGSPAAAEARRPRVRPADSRRPQPAPRWPATVRCWWTSATSTTNVGRFSFSEPRP